MAKLSPIQSKPMLRSINQIYGTKLEASDGELGRLKDFYFDPSNWVIRYVVVDTGTWLKSRQILISPDAFAPLRSDENVLRVKLARKQIETSPSFDSLKHITRRFEENYHRHFGWPRYWEGGATSDAKDVPAIKTGLKHLSENPVQPGDAPLESSTDLRSTLAVAGYQVFDASGPMGLITNFMIDEESWAIRELVVRIGHRFSGSEIRIPTSKIIRISHEESAILVETPEKLNAQGQRKTVAIAGSADVK